MAKNWNHAQIADQIVQHTPASIVAGGPTSNHHHCHPERSKAPEEVNASTKAYYQEIYKHE
jgi:hypothetical protein